MSSYLLRYKGKYRLKVPYDLRTRNFVRKLDGKSFEDIDMYISCQHGNMIFHYDKAILQAYIPSLMRGRSAVRELRKKIGRDNIFDVESTDSEILFKFNSKYIDEVAAELKAHTGGAGISPFSVKNLPKDTSYKVPNSELAKYKEIIDCVPKDDKLILAHLSNDFIKVLYPKKSEQKKIDADMKKKGIKGKEYIYSLGTEQWNDYLAFLKGRLYEYQN